MNSLEKTFAEGRSVSTTMIYPTFVGIIGWIATLLSLIGYTLIGISLNSLSSDYTEYSAVQVWAISINNWRNIIRNRKYTRNAFRFNRVHNGEW